MDTAKCHLCGITARDRCSTCGRPVCIRHRGFIGGRSVCISCMMMFDGFPAPGIATQMRKFNTWIERIMKWPFRIR
jgi:hypothetical protein